MFTISKDFTCERECKKIGERELDITVTGLMQHFKFSVAQFANLFSNNAYIMYTIFLDNSVPGAILRLHMFKHMQFIK